MIVSDYFKSEVNESTETYDVCTDIEGDIYNLVGQQTYDSLVALNQTTVSSGRKPLIFFGNHHGLCSIFISCPYRDTTEKNRIQAAVKQRLTNYLEYMDYSDLIVSEWIDRQDVQLPTLVCMFCRNEKELKRLQREAKRISDISFSRFRPVDDDKKRWK